MSLVTPSEPATPARPRAARERLTATLHGELATRWSRLTVAAASARGKHHRVNEDSHSPLDSIAPVFVVADGVGGGAMAAWTSRRLVARVHRALERGRIDTQSIRRALLDADQDIAKGLAERNATTGAATVALCAGIGAFLSKWWIAWVGDCRIYRISAGGDLAKLLSSDDTYRHLSEEPPLGGSLDDPARMIGNGAVTAPNVELVELGWDEMLVLCSDGVHKHVDAREMAGVMREDGPLARRCLRLLELARLNGSHDDATVLVVCRETQPRARLRRYAIGVLMALVAASLVFLWPDVHRTPPAQTQPSSRVQPESAP